MGLKDVAQFTNTGLEVASPVFPYRLHLKPSPSIQLAPTTFLQHIEDMKAIIEGSVLYTITALDHPKELGGEEREVGEVVLRSSVTTSLWADTSMFFRHQDMVEDLAARPEWAPHTQAYRPQHGACSQCHGE